MLKDYHGLILPGDPLPERRASGHIIMDDGNGERQVADTLMCAHCNAHFISVKGSGVERGFCLKCYGVICSAKCAGCYPFEKKMDDYEKGRLIVLA